ncbi:MAG: phosphate ABC transporter ATP-binding protein [Verrucomicrobiales bacterium]
MPDSTASILRLENVSIVAGARPILRGVTLDVPEGSVFGLIGPSGVGKSTLLKCCNRLTDLTPGLRVEGSITFRGQSVLGRRIDADALRAKIGILFQQPAVFPRSIMANVLFGVRHLGSVPRQELPTVAERALREVALWNEVKDRLTSSATHLSVGQQQRLCLARTLATNPDVILMDEPTSALDPQASEAIEQLILRFRGQRSIVIVTHNFAQARRVCGRVARLALLNNIGTVVEIGNPATVAAATREDE